MMSGGGAGGGGMAGLAGLAGMGMAGGGAEMNDLLMMQVRVVYTHSSVLSCHFIQTIIKRGHEYIFEQT